MRILILAIALLINLSGLYLAVAAGTTVPAFFSTLSDGEQRMVSSAMVGLSAAAILVGGLFKRRKLVRTAVPPQQQ